jgi:hypothetical protein
LADNKLFYPFGYNTILYNNKQYKNEFSFLIWQGCYLQQLCHNVWSLTEKTVSTEIIERAMDLVLRSNSLHYQDICEGLSNTQLNLIFAILAGETKLTASKTMQKYRLGTPRNVSKNKKVLEDKEIVEIHGSSIIFNDPVFEYWLKERNKTGDK